MESFARESFLYLWWTGLIQASGALLLALILFPLALRLGRFSFGQLLVAYLGFNVFLLLWGCLGHYVFLSFTYGKLYVSMDRMVDWFPFIPFGQWVLEQRLSPHMPCGYLIGDATLWQLRAIWAGVALPVWTLTYFSTKAFLRMLPLFQTTAAVPAPT